MGHKNAIFNRNAASVRSPTSSFAIICLTWLRTVKWLTWTAQPISLLVKPFATISRIWSSRGLRLDRGVRSESRAIIHWREVALAQVNRMDCF